MNWVFRCKPEQVTPYMPENDLATKGDFKDVRTDLRTEMELLRREMQAMELRMTVKLGAFIAASAAIIIAVLKVH